MTPTPRDFAVALMSASFDTASAALETHLRGGGSLESGGSAEFATVHLVTRALTDVRWAQRAASEGYPIQAYSLLRPAWEASQLCDLFVRYPEQADVWAAGEYRRFTPAKVREALGETGDPFYSFMSERSHPRFAGLQMSVFRRGEDDDEGENQRATLHLNDIPIEINEAYLAVATPSFVLALLTTHVGRLRFSDPSHWERSYAPMLREVAAALRAGLVAMRAAVEDTESQLPIDWGDEYVGILDSLADEVEAALVSASDSDDEELGEAPPSD